MDITRGSSSYCNNRRQDKVNSTLQEVKTINFDIVWMLHKFFSLVSKTFRNICFPHSRRAKNMRAPPVELSETNEGGYINSKKAHKICSYRNASSLVRLIKYPNLRIFRFKDILEIWAWEYKASPQFYCMSFSDIMVLTLCRYLRCQREHQLADFLDFFWSCFTLRYLHRQIGIFGRNLKKIKHTLASSYMLWHLFQNKSE